MNKDIDLMYRLLYESRMDLMYLPAGAIAWLFDRPEAQINAASALGLAARDMNPITDGSLLRADQNILILKTDSGHSFRVYPDGGYSFEGNPVDLEGCIDALQDVPDHESCGCGCGGAGTCMEPAPETDSEAPEGFQNMAIAVPQDDDEQADIDAQGLLQQLLGNAEGIDEEYPPYPVEKSIPISYDELMTAAGRGIQAYPNEDIGDDDDDAADLICKMHSIGGPASKMFGNTDEDTGSSDMSGGPIGTDMFDIEDDIANFLGMRPDIDQEVSGEEDEEDEVPTERL